MSCSATCMKLAMQVPVPARSGLRPGERIGKPEVSVPRSGKWWRRRRKARQLDVARLRENFAQVAAHGDEVPLYFYADLFIKHPEVRDMFPISMEAQRGHLVDALVKIVSYVDRVDDLTVFLQGLGRDHRKFGVIA